MLFFLIINNLIDHLSDPKSCTFCPLKDKLKKIHISGVLIKLYQLFQLD